MAINTIFNDQFKDPARDTGWISAKNFVDRSTMGMTQGQAGNHPKDQYVVVVQKVANGFTITCNDKMWVAKDVDELRDLFVTVIVADKLEGA